MAREKQFVFSVRTTAEGLKALNEVKAKVNMGWDELVIDAVCSHYNLDKAVMTLPKKETPTKQPPSSEPTAEQPTTVEREQPTEANLPVKKQKKNGDKVRNKST